uniref:Uncharacterized protein n=1 Tax=Arundo donax TaxID=35708 RepID=A0A0A9FUV0_ARUDO
MVHLNSVNKYIKYNKKCNQMGNDSFAQTMRKNLIKASLSYLASLVACIQRSTCHLRNFKSLIAFIH